MPNTIYHFAGENAFLSNFHPVLISYMGFTVRSTEHAYQMAKCEFQGQAAVVAAAKTPGKAKILARIAKHRADWHQIKDAVMLELLRMKFADPVMRPLLIATRDAMLIEGNNWNDQYWGMTWDRAADKWVGQNKLGVYLMQVRSEILESNK